MDANLTDTIVATYERIGTIKGVSDQLGIERSTVRRHLKKVGRYDVRPNFAGRVAQQDPTRRPLPKKGEVKRYFLTSAQNNTHVAKDVWLGVKVLLEHYKAEMLVGTYSYNKASYAQKSAKRDRGPTTADRQELWYDPSIEEYICDDPVLLAPGLEWRGEMNILPTAVRPLSDLEKYTGRHSGIFPHAKLAMQSVASGKNEPTKFNYTTGTITKRNYIQRKEGLKAEFHHVYGGLLVEVNSHGDWWVRQVNFTNKGVAHDLDMQFTPQGAERGNWIKTITWGDIHTATLDPELAETIWGNGGMLDQLLPEMQFLHDVLDFRARNTHVLKKGLIHERFQSWVEGHDNVEKEMQQVAKFLTKAGRGWCTTHVVESNHDQFLKEWLRCADYRQDPVNALYFLEAQLHLYSSIKLDPRKPTNMLRWASERLLGKRADLKFLDEDESCVVLDIEHGMHGHRGPGGSRGSASNLAKMGRRINRGHEHAASILDGVYTAGISGSLDQGYNKGPSGWSCSHIITYKTGKRAILTMWDNHWRA